MNENGTLASARSNDAQLLAELIYDIYMEEEDLQTDIVGLDYE